MEEEDEAPSITPAAQGTTDAEAKRERRESLSGSERLEPWPGPDRSWQREETHMPVVNPRTEAWHLYPQPWDLTQTQNKQNNGDE